MVTLRRVRAVGLDIDNLLGPRDYWKAADIGPTYRKTSLSPPVFAGLSQRAFSLPLFPHAS